MRLLSFPFIIFHLCGAGGSPPLLRSRVLGASPTPSPASLLSLPAACNPAYQPFELHSTSGTITVGWKGGAGGLQRGLQFVPGENDDAAGGPTDDGEGLPALAASPSATPSRSRGASHSRTGTPTPSRTPAAPRASASHSPGPAQLPAGVTCQWAIGAADPGVVVEVSWLWVRAGGSAGDPSCSTTRGAYLGVLEGSGPAAGREIGASVCFADSSVAPRPSVRSNSSSILLDFILEETRAPLSPITGFSVSYRVYDPTIPNTDCVLGPWGPWEACSASCGGGLRVRHRSVEKPASGMGTCTGRLDDEAPCAAASCPPAPDVPCSLAPWSAWGNCTLPRPAPGAGGGAGCGAGTTTRTRSILAPSSGRGTPCPNRTLLTEAAPCTIPCIARACEAAGVPLQLLPIPTPPQLSSGGMLEGGVFGIGSPPRHALPPTAPPALSALPPHWPGNTACAWAMDPGLGSTAIGAGEARYVNVTLWWVDLPGKPPSACAGNALEVSAAVDGGGMQPLKGTELGRFKCGVGGAALPITFTAPPGSAVVVSLATGEAPQTGPFSGFGASFVVGHGPSPIGTPPSPPSAAHTMVTLTLGLSNAHAATPATPFTSIPGDTLAGGIRGDIAQALGVPLYRIIGARVPPPPPPSSSTSGSSSSVTFSLIAPVRSASAATAGSTSPGAAPTQALLAELFSQYRDASSPLRRGAYSSYLSFPSSTTVGGAVVWSTPSSAYIDPPGGVVMRFPSGEGGGTATVTLENRGGGPLIVSGARLVFPPPSAQRPSPLSLLPPSCQGCSFPFTLLSGTPSPRLDFTLTIDPSKAHMEDFPLFAILSFSHSDPEGAVSIPVQVNWAGEGGGRQALGRGGLQWAF